MEYLSGILEETFVYVRPIMEVGVIALLIYNVLYFLRGTRGASVLAGVVIILIIMTSASEFLKFEVITWLLNNLWTMLAFALIVIFQPELRRAFAQLGSASFSQYKTKKKEAIIEVVNAIINLSKQRTGALLVFERRIGMGAIVANAVELDVRLNSFLIESIFYPNSPLHDGAIIIREERIIAAHAILPLPHDESSVFALGTRHRAAIGITEETDAVALIVSEETGMISLALGGRIKRNIKPDKLMRYLTGLLITNEEERVAKSIFGTKANEKIVEGYEDTEENGQ